MSISVMVSAVILVAVTLPWWRVVTDRRFVRLFPRPTIVLSALLLGWVAAVVVAAALAPALTVFAAVVAVVVAIVAAIRARSRGFGSSRRPPGSLSMARSLRSMADRHVHLDAVDRHGPIYTTAQFHHPVVGMVGISRAREVFRTHHEDLGASVLPFDEVVSGGFVRYMSDADHDHYGALFRRALSGPALEGVTSTTTEAVGSMLDRVRALGTLGGAALRESTAEVAQTVCFDALLGVRPDDRAHRDLLAVFTRVFGPPGAAIPRRPDIETVRNEVHSLPASERASMRSGIAVAGHDPDDPVVIDNLLVMIALGTANLAGLFGWVLQHLGVQASTWRSALSEGGPSATAFVSEVLRHSQSEYLYRRVRNGFDLDDFHIPAGWWLRVGVWESHREPAGFADPITAIERFGSGMVGSEFAPFGIDRHACTGANLSMRAACAFATTVAMASDIDIHPATGLARSFRHWSHWRPDDTLELRSTC